MINANEAREKTFAKLDEESGKILSEISSAIDSAVNEGKFQIVYDGNISDEVKQELKDLKYVVSSKNHGETIICW